MPKSDHERILFGESSGLTHQRTDGHGQSLGIDDLRSSFTALNRPPTIQSLPPGPNPASPATQVGPTTVRDQVDASRIVGGAAAGLVGHDRDANFHPS